MIPSHQITFYGAAQEVTGSCHLLETCGKHYLLDCGILQGGDGVERDFDFDPASISAVILSHVHLDHSGRLPRLVRAGFRGPIYCTSGTARLLPILLRDALSLYVRDLQHDNLKRERAGKVPLDAEYDEADVERVLSLCEPQDYQQAVHLGSETLLSFYDAGHILGSAIVELKLGCASEQKTLVFSGDLGNPDTSLMPEPTQLAQADIVLMESTYGDRDHRSQADTLVEFEQVLEQAAADNGNVLIPAFAVGRTQELLFQLGLMYHQDKLKGWRVFLDSPMGGAVTEVYEQMKRDWQKDDRALMASFHSSSLEQFLPCLTITASVEESIALNGVKTRAIIIAGSGMCTGGRIRHHFKHRLWQKNTHVIFVGFQAQGTLGRILVNGVKKIKLYGEEIRVLAKIHTLGGFSAHAGQKDLLKWAAGFTNQPRFFLVHGEPEAQAALCKALWRDHKIEAAVATRGASVHF